MGILEELKKLFSRAQTASGQGEVTNMADKKMSLEEVNEYMKKQCGFVRGCSDHQHRDPGTGRTFADFYASIFADGAAFPQGEELMFMSGGVAYCSPRCIIHVIRRSTPARPRWRSSRRPRSA